MILQRARGLHHALLICQAALVAVGLCVSVKIGIAFFAGISQAQLARYPLYGAVLILGLAFEALNRDWTAATKNLLTRNLIEQHSVTLRQVAFGLGALLLYVVLAKDMAISRMVLAVFVPVMYVSLFWSNRVVPRILAAKIFGGAHRGATLLIGPSARALRLTPWLRSKEIFGFRAIGLLTEDQELSVPYERLGSPAELEHVLDKQKITTAILLELPKCPEAHERMVNVLESRGVRLLILSDLDERLRHRAVHFEDGEFSFVATRLERLEDPVNRLTKRVLDVVVAAPIVLFVLPLLSVMVAVLHRAQSRGPLFFRQTRAGIQNHQFQILKFRTMHVAVADEHVHDERRVFSAGRWLRRLRLDEIPQFINVLMGDMSIVGPRPHLLEHNAQFAQQMGRYQIRTFVKPGITGLAQVRGFHGEVKTAADIRHRLESDIAYLETWRLALDITILFRTTLQLVLFTLNGLIRGRRRYTPQAENDAMSYPAPVSQADSYVPLSLRNEFRQILGIRFFTGSATDAVSLGMKGGLMVAPSAPVLLGLESDSVHRSAIASSELAITDSGLMVLLWRLLTGERVTRVSGLEYMKLLVERQELRRPGATLWVMPSDASMRKNLTWLRGVGFEATEADCYIAPNYQEHRGHIVDDELLDLVRKRKPAHVIMAVGGGVQEKLGCYLRDHLDFLPAIHCTGAAIGFLSGDQAPIPMWADRLFLGWLFRCVDNPGRFLPRYWQSRKLVSLMFEYHGRLPVGGMILSK